MRSPLALVAAAVLVSGAWTLRAQSPAPPPAAGAAWMTLARTPPMG